MRIWLLGRPVADMAGQRRSPLRPGDCRHERLCKSGFEPSQKGLNHDLRNWHAGREVRESMFEQVAHLFHDLDMGMQPISVLFPYLPIPAHWRRDRRALPSPKCKPEF